MYTFIIRQKVRTAFDKLSAGDYEYTLQRLSPDFEHIFPGDHAFGGRRRTVASFRRWFQRLFLVFPDLTFEIRTIVVKGPPWNTVVVVEWVDRSVTSDGQPYVNEGVHVMRVRWGRISSFHVYLDTQKLAEACHRLELSGVSEAGASPIVD